MLPRVAGLEAGRPAKVDWLLTGFCLVSVESTEGTQASPSTGWESRETDVPGVSARTGGSEDTGNGLLLEEGWETAS